MYPVNFINILSLFYSYSLQMIPYEFIYSFTSTILQIDKAIRWVGITNKEGLIINYC